LCRLLEGALGRGTGFCERGVYARALCSLLSEVISGSDRALTATHGFLRTRIAGPQLAQLPSSLLSVILDSVAKTARCASSCLISEGVLSGSFMSCSVW
jgi:hypothetical protein